MLLMDAVNKFATLAIQNGMTRHPLMAVYAALGKKLNPEKGPPPQRFVFTDKAIQTAVELTLGRPKVFRDVMAESHMPYPALWVEWEDAHRVQLRERFRQPEELDEIRPYPTRFGFLIEADPASKYRSGKVTFAWNQKENMVPAEMRMFGPGDIPNVSPITTYFHLDEEFPIDFVQKYPLTISKLWQDNPVQYEALHAIWRTAHHTINESAANTLPISRAMLFADTVGEYIMTWACQFVLREAGTNPRKKDISRVTLRSVDQSKINKNRLRRGDIPLLDHRTVHINPLPMATQSRSPLDYRRKSPHIHLVSSYLGWHGKIVFPYTRGSGSPLSARR